jgi:molecular chaperone GrpE
MNEDKQIKKEKIAQQHDDKVKKAQTHIYELKKELEVWKNKYFRALADYQNLERRLTEQLIAQQGKVNNNLILKFLDVLDDLEKGEIFIKDPGLKLIKDKFIKIFEEQGVKEIDVLGKPFDPHVAECIAVIQGDKDDTVIEVTRKGYQLNKEVLRVARVKVEKKKL